MDNIYKLVSYESVDGGVNNLQIVKIVTPSPYDGMVNIIKVFWSKKHLAEKRANKFIKFISK